METAATVLTTDLSTSGQVLFVFSALVALISAIGTIAQRSPLRAAMALLLHIVSLAGLYLSLHAHMLAAIQMLVYAGAVVVLFVFVIMLIGPGALSSRPDERGVSIKIVGAATIAIVAGTIAFQLGATDGGHVAIVSCAEGASGCIEFGGVDALSQAIFVDAAVPFELVSILLLIAIIVAIAVARGVHPGEIGGVETDKDLEGEKPTLPIRPRTADPLPGEQPAE
jgi:NADH-quinone oxidoreductase subunit J